LPESEPGNDLFEVVVFEISGMQFGGQLEKADFRSFALSKKPKFIEF
jgi:hypothetical protein